ncbi:DUF1428 domain-containing protein [Novosphingobium sp. BL-8A]|uniref:DUF1428 domain-containing protein n=1 Tax=Novosphingobium sp. BL-8A TaxID=3127639 RepID=UPI0037582B52
MAYVDGFVIPVPLANKDKFIAHAREFDAYFIEYGATRVWECWGDDVPHGKQTDFHRAVEAKEDEAVCFSWIEWPDKETRDRQMGLLMELMKNDPRFDPKNNPPPFDGARMIFGGFQPVVVVGE